MWITRGLKRVETDEISAGDIVWLAGPPEIGIGDTFSKNEGNGYYSNLPTLIKFQANSHKR